MKHGSSQAPRGARGRSQRQLRAGEVLRHALVEVLARAPLRDPDLQGVSVTVTEVRLSPDLRQATVFVLPLGGERTGAVIAGLRRAAPFLRRRIAGAVTMKHLPALRFEADTAFERGARLDDLLRMPAVARDLAARGEADGEEEGGDNGA